jgi:hypothetical protein
MPRRLITERLAEASIQTNKEVGLVTVADLMAGRPQVRTINWTTYYASEIRQAEIPEDIPLEQLAILYIDPSDRILE